MFVWGNTESMGGWGKRKEAEGAKWASTRGRLEGSIIHGLADAITRWRPALCRVFTQCWYFYLLSPHCLPRRRFVITI
ncbi:hypothetical protein RRG08_058060 [Elysia crispata]|uniref:Uncharacterized protein n=1 Tax=Elysia crispata TaxID=231223 RepID=A0AAE1AC18_9GAST|nr:hypothetical protein RRG08_058060 [Elysia crispata]